MTFEEILPLVKAGQKARRGFWEGTRRGLWLELVQPALPDGRQLMPQLVLPDPNDGTLRPFAGANWDLLADDWEVV